MVYLSVHNSLAVVKTNIELDSHADTCVADDDCLVVHDDNSPVNVFGYDPKAESKHANLANVAVAYMEPETSQVVIILIIQVIEMKSHNHFLLCLMQCCMNGVLIDDIPKFLAPILSVSTHTIQLKTLLMSTIQLLFL